ncbi:MAG TPA: SpoVA/SpoVAEb family sporulation membrane protein [Firmicutes bacterium]|nr:SpoVA/SpoVAEb family sporulation membrane protein [Bacillota bacterium]
MAYLMAFLIGGALCAVAQAITDLLKLNPALTMVLSVSAGAILSSLSLYGPLVKVASAGATVPLPGFGHVLVQGMLEGATEGGFIGLMAGGLKAASLVLTIAILAGFFLSLFFNPKG